MVKNLPANAEATGLIPGLGRTPGGETGIPLQYSCLENSMDRGAWHSTVHGITKSHTQLSKHMPIRPCGVRHTPMLYTEVRVAT